MASSPTPPIIPKTMHGIQISRTGPPSVLDHLTSLPVPTPGPHTLLVQNTYIGINYIDTYFRTGLYPCALPSILGREAEGRVLALGPGPTHGLAVGDHVVWLGTDAYAEYSAVPAAKAIRVPEGIRAGEAAAAFLQGLTALTLVREVETLRRGDWVLVHAAAGGVGGWLCQILRAIGVRVIGTVGSGKKVEEARGLGAEWVVDLGAGEDVVGRVGEVTGGEGVKVVFDGVGRATFDQSLECVGRKGTVVSFGNASGAVEPLVIGRLSEKNVKVLRPKLDNYIYTREEFEYYAKELFQMMRKDKLNVRIHEVYPLQDVARAHEDIESRKTTGKLLMKP